MAQPHTQPFHPVAKSSNTCNRWSKTICMYMYIISSPFPLSRLSPRRGTTHVLRGQAGYLASSPAFCHFCNEKLGEPVDEARLVFMYQSVWWALWTGRGSCFLLHWPPACESLCWTSQLFAQGTECGCWNMHSHTPTLAFTHTSQVQAHTHLTSPHTLMHMHIMQSSPQKMKWAGPRRGGGGGEDGVTNYRDQRKMIVPLTSTKENAWEKVVVVGGGGGGGGGSTPFPPLGKLCTHLLGGWRGKNSRKSNLCMWTIHVYSHERMYIS